MSTLPDRDLLRTDEVAAYYAVTIRTVYLWIENDKLSIVPTPGGQLRITRASVLEWQGRIRGAENSVKSAEKP